MTDEAKGRVEISVPIPSEPGTIRLERIVFGSEEPVTNQKKWAVIFEEAAAMLDNPESVPEAVRLNYAERLRTAAIAVMPPEVEAVVDKLTLAVSKVACGYGDQYFDWDAPEGSYAYGTSEEKKHIFWQMKKALTLALGYAQ